MLFSKNYIIYKITNTKNGKVYIGETCRSLKERWYQHTNKDSCCIKLKRAINKYGKESFVIEQIDHALTKEEAFNKEKFWIKQYKSTNTKYGYNILECGYTSSNKKPRKVFCYETGQIFDSVGACSREIGMSTSIINGCCHGRRPTCKGKHYCFMDENERPCVENIKWTKPHFTKVRCIETGTVFKCVRDAAKWLGKSEMTIFNCLSGKAKRAGGFHWQKI